MSNTIDPQQPITLPGVKIDTPENPLSLRNLERRARSGQAADVDFLMGQLTKRQTFARCKVIDYALSLVTAEEGEARIRHFLFHGSHMQRNYAALYFKRRGNRQLLVEAVAQGCIDSLQAYAE